MVNNFEFLQLLIITWLQSKCSRFYQNLMLCNYYSLFYEFLLKLYLNFSYFTVKVPTSLLDPIFYEKLYSLMNIEVLL